MRETKTHGLSHRLTAALLCLCMAASMLSGFQVRQAYAAAAEETKHIVPGSRVADPDTMDDYLNRLLTETTGSRYAGRVWTDKSVFAYGDNSRASSTKNPSHFDGTNKITLDMATDGYVGDVLFNADFAHVFSALASSQVVNEYPPSPVDLVIVFDMSGSMGQDTRYGIDTGLNIYVEHTAEDGFPAAGVPMADRIKNSRIQKTLDAINQTIDTLMAQNPQNRVAVCGYGANAVVLMPLGHYKRVNNQPYLSVGGMETLYHPSDLVYRTVGDEVKKNGTPLPLVSKDGWYWMNNRDTCYTVVVNAEYNTYTGILNDNGDGKGQEGAQTGTTDEWTNLTKTVSNNVLSDDGEPVKAFPGEWNDDGKTPKSTYGDLSRTVYTKTSSGEKGWAAGLQGVLDSKAEDGESQLMDEGKPTSHIKLAMKPTAGLKADDYVGYFTNTQGGIYLAYKQLADSEATTYTETLTNGVVSTVARIPAAIIMSDGGANFSFNEMGEDDTEFTVNDWNGRYGRRTENGSGLAYITDDTVNWEDFTNPPFKGFHLDLNHRLNQNTGDEWYKVYLPGNDTLDHDGTSADGIKGYWDGLHGIYNQGADIYEDGTLSSPPVWDQAGIFYSSDNDVTGTAGTVMEVLLTASYMNQVVKEHYDHGWKTDNATLDSRVPLSTYTMNVDTVHVPLWGRMRLYPTLDPKEYNLNNIDAWYNNSANNDKFGTNETIQGTLPSSNYAAKAEITKELLFVGGEIQPLGGGDETKDTITGLKQAWEKFKSNIRTEGPNQINSDGKPINIAIEPIKDSVTYEAGGEDEITVTNDDVVKNIAYNNDFFDVTSGALETTFDRILALILGNVFVPVSGDNDAGVGDSITYQDPIGEYMEIKNGSITATPYHVHEYDEHEELSGKPQDYDMAMLLFGEMHGMVRTGVYDWHWNDEYIREHSGNPGEDTFTQGWYSGEAATATYGGPDDVPKGNEGSGTALFDNATQARAKGWVYRMNFETAAQFVPILGDIEDPGEIPEQMKNTVYTMYRFAGTTENRNAIRRNPIYGDVDDELKDAWNAAVEKWQAEGEGREGKLPDFTADVMDQSEWPGVYRLSDIRVWVEDTGDFVDTDGAIAPNSGYDRSLYVNIPAAAIPTELATITLGRSGVLSYETNLGSDHDSIVKDSTYTENKWKNYCYQSTPLRLFYAVGLEEDLILRDSDGNQIGVDFNAISAEYIQSHTVEGQDYVWFISNFYSNTTYDHYDTGVEGTTTRGDPTVTFSPGSDNRYYVFQKPLPLYAHAYRATSDGLKPVDTTGKDEWSKEDNLTGGNGGTTWETYNGAPQRAGSWVGGQYMGTYDNKAAFVDAKGKLKVEKDGKQYITDSTGTKYQYVDDGIVFLRDDLLEHVTSKADGTGYENGSVSFSSDDYFFILLEFYVPDEGTGVDNKDQEVPGTQKGHMVQYAIARKGSEFGSGYAASGINNGDMLCWTDVDSHLNIEFEYLSMTDTGDLTRGEPTFEKLTFDKAALKDYLTKTCGITNDEALDAQVQYWTDKQKDPLVVAALKAAAGDGDPDGKPDNEDKFNAYFKFAVSTRPGGIRSGDMSNNVQVKRVYNSKEGKFDDANVTNTSRSYYLPTISGNSGTDDDVIINNYLGNNGRLEIANQMLHVTKMLEVPEGYTLTDTQKDEVFNYQIFVQGVTGERSAVRTLYNEFSDTWERRLAYIDVLTDNSDLLVDDNSNRALFDLVEENGIKTARHVVQGDDGNYYYADDDGNPTAETCRKTENELYYLYLPSNGTGETAQHTRRLYQDEEYDTTASAEGYNREHDFNKNGTTTFFLEGQREETPDEPGADNRNSYRKTEKDSVDRPAGTKSYWALDAELIPVSEVKTAEGEADGLETVAAAQWSHDTAQKNCTDQENGHRKLSYVTLVTRKPQLETSETNFASPFKTRTMYMIAELNFGYNANDDGGPSAVGQAMTEADLYDKIVPSVDRPDLFGSLSLDNIAQYTAEFTLKHGEGLLLTGLQNRVAYRFTEKLTEEQLKDGYTLQKISHVQQRGSESLYLPGIQEIPIYTQTGAKYGEKYPGAESELTENGLTWAENPLATMNYEPFAHTNAVMWEYYATMEAGTSGNHHQPLDATDEVEDSMQIWDQTNANTYNSVKGPHTVSDNPSCATYDVEQEDGTILHYMYQNGKLVDPHYNGEASTYLRNMARYGVSPTVHFAVTEEDRNPSYATTAPADNKGSENYTGVYSVFGNTGWFEEQANFVNTFEPGNISITKDLEPYEGSVLTEQDKDTEFSFTLSLKTDSGVGMPDGVYSYVVTDKDGKEVKSGRLLPKTGPTALYPPEDANDIRASDAGNTTWSFTLKGGQTMTVLDLPVDSTFTYKVTETTPGDGYNVTDSELTGDTDGEETVTGTVKPGSEDPVKVTFTNTKTPPKPAVVSLSLKKTVSGAGFDWTDKEFTFLVAPAAGNPEGDPFTEAKQVKITAEGETVDIFQGLQFEKPGVYTYTVKELLSTIPGVSSDGKIYTVQVDVSDAYDENGYYTGSLNAKITVNGEPMTAPITITFNNQYDKNEIRVPFRARKVLERGVLTDRAFDFMLECTGFEPESVPMPASNSAGVPEENSTQPTQPAETQPTEPPAPSDAPESTEDTVPPETTAPTEDTVPPETPAPTEGTEPPETTEGSEPTVGEPSEIQPTEPASSEEESGPLDESRPQGEGAPINTYRFIGGLRGPMLRHSPEDVTNPTGESQPADESQPTDGADPTGEPTPTEGPTEPTGEPAPTEGPTEPTGEPAPTEGPTEPTGNPDDGISPASVGVGTAVTVSNDADGLIDFGSLTFTEAGTYTFKISEVAGTAPGMEYDTREYTVTVVIVRDATSGALKLESVTYDPAVPEFELPTFTNRVKTGSLTVEKQVTGEGDKTKDFRFTVTFDPKLTDPAGLTITKFDASGAATAEKFTIGADGSLVFTLKHGEKLTVTGLPVNTVYTVKEDDYTAEGYTATITDPEGDPDGVGTIRVDQEDVVTVVNDIPAPTPKTGSLTVSKTVTGDGDPAKEWHFRVELSDSTVNGLYGDMNFTDGVAQVTLRSGESATATGLPEGTAYTVTELEANQDGYTTSSVGESGVIPADGVAEARFVNDKPTTPPPPPGPKTGSLTVSKTVTGDGDPTKEWHFRVELSDSSVNGLYGDMNFTDGVAQVTLRSGESATANGLPEGTAYTVTELEANQDGYTTSSDGESGVIPADGVAEARFVNNKPTPGAQYGDLIVEKIVTGAGDRTKDFRFTVTFDPADVDFSQAVITKYDAAGNPTADRFQIVDGYLEFNLKHGEKLTVRDLPVGTPYTVTELDANRDGYTTSSAGAVGTIPYGVTTARFANDLPTTPPPPTTPTTPMPSTTPDDTPKTGDGSALGLWMALAILSLLCAGWMALTLAKAIPQKRRHS